MVLSSFVRFWVKTLAFDGSVQKAPRNFQRLPNASKSLPRIPKVCSYIIQPKNIIQYCNNIMCVLHPERIFWPGRQNQTQFSGISGGFYLGARFRYVQVRFPSSSNVVFVDIVCHHYCSLNDIPSFLGEVVEEEAGEVVGDVFGEVFGEVVRESLRSWLGR